MGCSPMKPRSLNQRPRRAQRSLNQRPQLCRSLQRWRNSARGWPLSQQGGRLDSTLGRPCPRKKSTQWATTRLENYARYETRLDVCMTKTLGKAALQLYTAVATMFLPIPPENRQPLMEDLESDPFVDHALTSTACELYYRYGKLLAPITAALTTAKYCQFGHQCPRRIEEDGLESQQCDFTGGVAPTRDNHADGLNRHSPF